ncbi:MAG: MOSC domain-containing protein [Blastocatellia bacterium]
MRIISINVGDPQEVSWKGRTVITGIFKQPVEGPIRLRKLNLDGDRQADLTVHGGHDKAVYAYPSEHYSYWRVELPGAVLPWGMFGENFTTEGLREDETHIGDQFRIGSALVMVTQPRLPCYKLGLKFGRDDMVKLFLQSRRTGFYFSVLEEGELAPGDAIARVAADPAGVSVADITNLYVSRNPDPELIRRAVAVEALPANWRDHLLEQLAE